MAHQEEPTRAALLTERARVVREIAELTHGDDAAFPSPPYDTTDEPAGEAADAAETLEDDERNQALLVVLRARLAEIDAALAALE
jgi:RNA polymerase-binding transcription factor DksA